MELARHRRDPGHELNGARACPDHGDALARKINGVVPVCGMELRALEFPAAWDIWPGRPVEQPDCRDQDLRIDPRAIFGLERPRSVGIVESRSGDFGIEADMRGQPVFGDAVFQVSQDLVLAAVAPRPDVILLEGIGVELRGHIAGRARIVVVAPDAAGRRRALEDREAFDPGLLQRDTEANAPEAAADDRDRRGPRLHGW